MSLSSASAGIGLGMGLFGVLSITRLPVARDGAARDCVRRRRSRR
ncbi:hypothetical protein ACFPH6_08895 [Streptomyces xiangluensis]|uniref:Uncharacterized protein n=1 Tax=Streptomyces xiangluensis TaxID=2665720 RepID=A0ABV8YH95_9ACTN